MRTCGLQIAALAIVFVTIRPLAAQTPQASAPAGSSSADAKASQTEDAKPPALNLTPERLRELADQPAPLQQSLVERPTFRIQVEERQRFLTLLRTPEPPDPLDNRPPPPGGVYGYEVQRIALGTINHGGTRMEPYAAFSGKEALTLAIEGLITKYLGGRALSSLTDFERARAEAAAREEAARAVREYCAEQIGGGAGIDICSESFVP